MMPNSFYATDLTNSAWAFISPLLPEAQQGGRPRTTNVRAVLDAIFYLLRTGCQWRLLPREFPVWAPSIVTPKLEERGRVDVYSEGNLWTSSNAVQSDPVSIPRHYG